MNVRTTKPTPPRIDGAYSSRLNIQTYGGNNLYPQDLLNITAASGTASLCLARYAKFVEGNGFANDQLATMSLNADGQTADDILRDIVGDVCRFGGFALHLNYNVLGEIAEMRWLPFENCRLEEEDDAGHVEHIVVHPDWTGQRTRNGVRLYVDEDHCERLHVFNPLPDVVQAQIEEAGGIDQYKGQVLYCSTAGFQRYPVPIYDACVSDISTDEGLGNVKNRNVRNNFLPACMIITKRNAPYAGEDGRDAPPMIAAEEIARFQGDERTGKIMVIECENTEDKPEVVDFPVRNNDKEFTETDASVIERIYAQFHQELFYSIRLGKLGFSGDVMRDAYEYYAGEVTNEQRFIERVFVRVAQYWYDPLLRNANFAIAPLKYMSNDQ